MGFSFLNGLMSNIAPVIISLCFILVFGIIIGRVISALSRHKKNNASPILTVGATMVTKRADVRHYNNSGTNDMNGRSSSTTYYATFEVDSGDRLEFKVTSNQYGMLAEHDIGKLTFQGTRYLGFERNRN